MPERILSIELPRLNFQSVSKSIDELSATFQPEHHHIIVLDNGRFQ